MCTPIVAEGSGGWAQDPAGVASNQIGIPDHKLSGISDFPKTTPTKIVNILINT
jgi:hypothetical protein